MNTLSNNEIQRMQTLAGLSPDKHKFEIFLEQKSHLTLNEILFQLNEDWRKDQEEAEDYWNNLSDQEKNAAVKIAQKLKPDDLNLTKDQFDDKVVNLAPNNKLVKTPLWKRIVTGALSLIFVFNSLSGPLVTAFKNDNNFNKITAQTQQAQSKLNKLNTANFNDVGNIKQAEKFNPSLDDPGDGEDAMHIQYKTSGYAIKDQQRQDIKQFADNVVDIVDDGNDVEVNATSTYSHQPSDPDNENKAVDGKKLDDARANSFKAVSKEDIKKEAESRGYKVTEEGDLLKIKTEKGTNTVTITSDTAKEVGKPNKTGEVDQGTVVKTKVVQGTPEKAQAIWQSFVKDMGLPKMPGEETPSPTDTEPGREKADNPDIQSVADRVKSNSNLKGIVGNINNETELEALLLALVGTVNPEFQVSSGGSNVNRGLTRTSNLIKEVNIPNDVAILMKIINQDSSLKQALLRVNNEKEWTELLVRVIVPLLPEDFKKNKNAIKSAFFKARNRWQKTFIEWEKQNKDKSSQEKMAHPPIDDPKDVLDPKFNPGKSLSPSISTTNPNVGNITYSITKEEIQRMQKLAGILK
jgi:hypothetical protein